MKKLILFIALFLKFNTIAQTEYSAYIPMRTYHFDRTYENIHFLSGNEGGNIGLILIRTNNSECNNTFTEIHLGAIRNSYGDLSVVGQVGYGYKLNNFKIGGAIGLATGYKKMYETHIIGNKEYTPSSDFMPGIFKNNGISPTTTVYISYTKYKIKPTLIISPLYINGGIIFKIK